MDKRIMKFKLLSYKQALRKAQDKGDIQAVKSWTEHIAELEQQIEETA
jgi:hypothetical protein